MLVVQLTLTEKYCDDVSERVMIKRVRLFDYKSRCFRFNSKSHSIYLSIFIFERIYLTEIEILFIEEGKH